MSIYIITPCSRVQHLESISKTIPNECIWVIVYDSNYNDQILPYGDIILRPKNVSGSYGKPHINYALDTLKLTNSFSPISSARFSRTNFSKRATILL